MQRSSCGWSIGSSASCWVIRLSRTCKGTLLYDVRDEGRDVRYGARFSVTNAETGFHTDNSFGEAVVDWVGLLCLNPAKSGGANQVVSGYTVHNEAAGPPSRRAGDTLPAVFL